MWSGVFWDYPRHLSFFIFHVDTPGQKCCRQLLTEMWKLVVSLLAPPLIWPTLSPPDRFLIFDFDYHYKIKIKSGCLLLLWSGPLSLHQMGCWLEMVLTLTLQLRSRWPRCFHTGSTAMQHFSFVQRQHIFRLAPPTARGLTGSTYRQRKMRKVLAFGARVWV